MKWFPGNSSKRASPDLKEKRNIIVCVVGQLLSVSNGVFARRSKWADLKSWSMGGVIAAESNRPALFFRLMLSLSGPDLSQDSAEVPAEDQFDICVGVPPANQTVSDVKHAPVVVYAIGIHFVAEGVTGFVQAP